MSLSPSKSSSMVSCRIENQIHTSYQGPPDTVWPLSPPLSLPITLQPHSSCFRAFRIFVFHCRVIRQKPTHLSKCVISFGASFPMKEASILFPDIGVLLPVFWSQMEWRWPGESSCCGHEPISNFCFPVPPGSEPLRLYFSGECTASLSGGGGGVSSTRFLCSVYIPHTRWGTKLLWLRIVIIYVWEV